MKSIRDQTVKMLIYELKMLRIILHVLSQSNKTAILCNLRVQWVKYTFGLLLPGVTSVVMPHIIVS